jgi:hypothetical protein
LCIKLVIETSLHYDAWSEEHQIRQIVENFEIKWGINLEHISRTHKRKDACFSDTSVQVDNPALCVNP